MSKKKRCGKPEPYPFHGLPIYRSNDVEVADGRKKTRLYLKKPGEKENIDTRNVASHKGEPFEETVKAMAQKMVTENRDALLQPVKDGNFPQLSIDSIYYLCEPDIRRIKTWAGKAEVYRTNWENGLQQALGELTLTDPQLGEKIEAAVNDLMQRKAAHRLMSDKERECWIFLGDLLDYAVEQGILAKNPIKALAAKSRNREAGEVLRNLAKRSFSEEEIAKFDDECCSNLESPEVCAALLRSLTGMTIPEVCGLNFGDVKQFTFPAPSDGLERAVVKWMEVVREYRQPRRDEAILTHLLPDSNRYRRIPCTEEVSLLLSRQIRARKREDPTSGSDTSLFVKDGVRLTPNDLKAVEEQLIERALLSPINLPLGRGSKKGRFRGDFLRANANYYLRNICRMDDAETAALLGVLQPHTYGASYVDWSYPYVLVYLKEKMERWHRRFLRINSRSPRAQQMPMLYEGVVIAGVADTDTDLVIRSANGVILVNTPGEEGKTRE